MGVRRILRRISFLVSNVSKICIVRIIINWFEVWCW